MCSETDLEGEDKEYQTGNKHKHCETGGREDKGCKTQIREHKNGETEIARKLMILRGKLHNH